MLIVDNPALTKMLNELKDYAKEWNKNHSSNQFTFEDINEIMEYKVDELMEKQFGKKYIMNDSDTFQFTCYGCLISHAYNLATEIKEKEEQIYVHKITGVRKTRGEVIEDIFASKKRFDRLGPTAQEIIKIFDEKVKDGELIKLEK